MSNIVHATTHVRFFEELSGGDARQLWARDRRPGRDNALFYLERGEAPKIRRAGLVPGALECPVPGCPCPIFKTVRGGTRRDHFVHDCDPQIGHHGPEVATIYATEMIQVWLRGILPGRPLVTHTGRDGIVELRARGRKPVSIFFIARPLAPTEHAALHAAAAQNALCVFFFWNRRPLLDSVRDPVRGLRALPGRTVRAYVEHGFVAWLSIDSKSVAVPLLQQDVLRNGGVSVKVMELSRCTLEHFGHRAVVLAETRARGRSKRKSTRESSSTPQTAPQGKASRQQIGSHATKRSNAQGDTPKRLPTPGNGPHKSELSIQELCEYLSGGRVRVVSVGEKPARDLAARLGSAVKVKWVRAFVGPRRKLLSAPPTDILLQVGPASRRYVSRHNTPIIRLDEDCTTEQVVAQLTAFLRRRARSGTGRRKSGSSYGSGDGVV